MFATGGRGRRGGDERLGWGLEGFGEGPSELLGLLLRPETDVSASSSGPRGRVSRRAAWSE